MEAVIRPVAYIRSDFSEKFGIPRQSGLVDALTARIVFEPEFRRPEAIRDIEGFSHLWLIWQFSQALTSEFHPTVRPPRLGGNRRVGVFASRAPYRPNGLGLSCVRLLGVERDTPDAPALLNRLKIENISLSCLAERDLFSLGYPRLSRFFFIVYFFRL